MTETVEVQADSIANLKESAKTTNEVLDALLETRAQREKQERNLSARLSKLEKDNEETKAFLKLRVPSELGSLLNSSRTRADDTLRPADSLIKKVQ